MIKIYKRTLTGVIESAFAVLLFSGATIFGLILKIEAIWYYSIAIFFSLAFIFDFINMLNYAAIISDEDITIKIFSLSIFNKYKTMRFDEITDVINLFAPLPERIQIALVARNKLKKEKTIFIYIRHGLPWEALIDILDRVPQSANVVLDSWVENRLKKIRLKRDKEK